MKSKKFNFMEIFIKYKVLVFVLILAAILSITSEYFLLKDNILNVFRQITVNCIVASGFTVLLASGMIDLAIGHCLAFIGVLMAMMIKAGLSLPVSILICICLSMIFSMVSAVVISAYDLPPFVVTLAMQSVFRGVTYIITKCKPIIGLPESFIFLGQGKLGIVPIPVIIAFFVVVTIYILINKTAAGRHILALGGNPDAAKTCGISPLKTRLFVFAASGFCAGVGAVVLTARTASAQIAAGDNLAMDAIASVVIGGTSMNGGNANIVGTVLGCMVIGLVNNGLNLLGVDSNWQILAKGVMVLLAVLLDTLTSKYYANRARKQMLKS